jgi:hypothetical protein
MKTIFAILFVLIVSNGSASLISPRPSLIQPISPNPSTIFINFSAILPPNNTTGNPPAQVRIGQSRPVDS